MVNARDFDSRYVVSTTAPPAIWLYSASADTHCNYIVP